MPQHFPAVRWYDWKGTLSERTLKNHWNTINLLGSLFSAEDCLDLANLDLKDPSFKISLFKHTLLLEENLVIVDHLNCLVEDSSGVLAFDHWMSDIFLRDNLSSLLRSKIPSLIDQIKKDQNDFNILKDLHKDSLESFLEEAFLEHSLESFLPLIVPIAPS